jgi:thioesterase domain-containing protein
LARALGEAPPLAPPGDASLLTLKAGQEPRPLFLLGGGRGGKPELTLCARLVSRLPADATVYGLLAPAVPRTVEEAARLHLATLTRLQPSGPYRIGGECIGGVIAYEIAQQLLAQGETVELLLLLDSFCPNGVGAGDGPPRWRRLSPRRLFDKALALVEAGAAFAAELPRRNADAAPWPVELWHRLTVPANAKHHIATCMRYRPQPYPGRITILASRESLASGLAPPWQALARGGAVVYQAPGDHDSYTRRYVRESAEQLRLCLEAQARTGA